MNKNNPLLYIALLGTLYTTQLLCSAGDLDTSFGTNGIVLTNLTRTDFINSCTVQASDDKIIVAGAADGYHNRMGIARYTANGALDTSYNSTGYNLILIGSASQAQGLTLQSDGKAIFTGYATQSQTNIPYVRLNTDGTVNSYVTTSVGDGAQGSSIVQQSDAKVIIGGLEVSGQANFTLVRYNSDNTLDTSFGPDANGKVITSIGYYAVINQIALQSDGKIIAGGSTYSGGGFTFALARYNTNGSLDTTFGPDATGIITTVIQNESQINSIAIQNDGYIVVGGYTIDADGVTKFLVVRYDTNGNLDSTFGNAGVVITQLRDESKIYSIALQPDGKIVAGGYSYGDLSTDFAIARYNTDGTLDTSFGTNGITYTNPGGHNSESHITSLVLQSTGKIIAAGFSDTAFAIVRYLA